MTRLRSSCVSTLRSRSVPKASIFAAPFKSALTHKPLPVWYIPRLTRFPDGFQRLSLQRGEPRNALTPLQVFHRK
ncbi:hypothetical protein [Okeania sp. SIO2C2]|uniref:hypothetical protein n=1 Tax=Okeania sp. SIO2C2 TaxID=2607787 RepID=UPI00257F4324|nr:hypothetical protein [Okeania sp. SIO2C2]